MTSAKTGTAIGQAAVLNGQRIAYWVDGSGDPGMLFVHGWMGNHTHLAPLVEHFARGHRVTALDLRGHGRSDAPPADDSNYTVTALADDCVAVARAAGLDRPVVVGHSLGGLAALELAGRGAARAAVLLDPPALVNERSRQYLRDQVAGVRADHDGSFRRTFLASMFGPHDRADRSDIMASAAAIPIEVAAAAYAGLAAFDAPVGLDRAATAGVPLALIVSDINRDAPADLAKAAPGLSVGRTLGAGHFHQLEVPDQVIAMIERFLATLSAPG
jgi:pimeloyl-ACP methyl ester carboxylesterase